MDLLATDAKTGINGEVNDIKRRQLLFGSNEPISQVSTGLFDIYTK